MRRVVLLVLALGSAALLLRADVVTLPAAASLVGLNPFFSDVRAFNTSYSSSLQVTATYRCFIGPCPSTRTIQFTLAPRESRAFDDIVASADGFNAHDTGGGVEFESSGAPGQLVVTSRLYSTAPLNSVGMFIPGLPASRAFSLSVLTSVRHDPLTAPPSGFRTNVGLFNPNDDPLQVTFTLFDAVRNRLGVPVSKLVAGHSGVQISGLFETAGVGDLSIENAVVVVLATRPVFAYAAVIDNRTADPIFVQGGPDQAPAFTTPTRTDTPGGPTPTRTATGLATATPTVTTTSGTPTASPTITLSPTITQIPTITLTPTITLVPSITPTPSNTPIPSITPTASSTVPPTFTFTPSKTFTATQTGIATATGTKTATPTNTGTKTATPLATATFTRTATPTLAPPTLTRTATKTPTPNPNHIVSVGVIDQFGNPQFVDSISGTFVSTVHAGDTVEWQWVNGTHSTTSGNCVPGGCTADLKWTSGTRTTPAMPFTFTFTAGDVGGTFNYFCNVHQFMMQGVVSVIP
jgi:hypothetical protein